MSTLGSSAFVKWQLPQEFDAPMPNARRQQLSDEFRRNFGPQSTGKRPITEKVQKNEANQPSSGAKTPGKFEGKSALSVALTTLKLPEFTEPRSSGVGVNSHILARAQQLAHNATPAELSVVQRALRLMPSQTNRASGTPVADAVAVPGRKVVESKASYAKKVAEAKPLTSTPKHISQQSPDDRDNRWQFTSWHGMQPQQARQLRRDTVGSKETEAHYRIHPEWGWDAPQC